MQEEEKSTEQQAGWVFTPGTTGATVQQPVASVQGPAGTTSPASNVLAEWTASEYVANPKNTSWYSMLAAATLVLAVFVYFITSDVISTVVIVVLGIIVGVFAARQPNVLAYQLTVAGIQMGPRFYPYSTFKSFSVVADGAFNHVSLLPLKRFMPALAIHYSPDDEDTIINTLADYLPYEEHKRDMVENFSRRVRF